MTNYIQKTLRDKTFYKMRWEYKKEKYLYFSLQVYRSTGFVKP